MILYIMYNYNTYREDAQPALSASWVGYTYTIYYYYGVPMQTENIISF